MKCPKCGSEMIKFGVTESGYYKFHCHKCYTIREGK